MLRFIKLSCDTLKKKKKEEEESCHFGVEQWHFHGDEPKEPCNARRELNNCMKGKLKLSIHTKDQGTTPPIPSL